MTVARGPELLEADAGVDEALARAVATRDGLSSREAALRIERFGPNVAQTRTAGPLDVLLGQLRNPLLLLLAGTTLVALALGDRTDAAIILGIIVLSVGLGFFNEYRSVRAIADLRGAVRHTARALRDGTWTSVEVSSLVPGDIIDLTIGDIVPADVRLIEARGLTCDEAALTGESMPAEKTVTAPAAAATAAAATAAAATAAAATAAAAVTPQTYALSGTVVRSGSARGVVARTGSRTELGAIATRVAAPLPETAFQVGLRAFSALLVWITAGVTSLVFVVNALLQHGLVESLLFALAIAVSLTPQLLPAIVTISLATGARRMAKRSVLVKRLVSIEDLGNMTVLFTDKTGTLTQGRIAFTSALDARGAPSAEVLRLGLLCSEAAERGQTANDGNATRALDAALWASPEASPAGIAAWRRIAETPFDYDRRVMSVLVDDGTRRMIVTKGAPESVLERCTDVSPEFRELLTTAFAAGSRVIAVATRDAPGAEGLQPGDERDLVPAGILAFFDPPKADAASSIARLEKLGITVKIVTGDNELVAQHVCRELALPVAGTRTGSNLAAMSDAEVVRALDATTIFARVSPEQKARLIGLQRAAGADVGFLGDGVNDAVALHDADVGISVESAADVAKDAADIVLITKDLGILADGVVEGRRIFANTIKYVLMGTSSNFGNMLSTAAGSMFLPFLPLLPSQILLNNLLYDCSEMTIPTDNVDEEQLHRPAHWDMRLIRRFMFVFGPINSVADFSIFAVMLAIFHAGPALFRSGYFVESFVTQTLIIFAIRTRRVPFFRSRASWPLAATTLAVALVGGVLPFVPVVGPFLGFVRLPATYFVQLAAIAAAYLVLVETGKMLFFRHPRRSAAVPGR